LLGAARAVSTISINTRLGTGSARNARTDRRDRIAASRMATESAVSASMAFAPRLNVQI
jgi:hypothetical protein